MQQGNKPGVQALLCLKVPMRPQRAPPLAWSLAPHLGDGEGGLKECCPGCWRHRDARTTASTAFTEMTVCREDRSNREGKQQREGLWGQWDKE